MVEGNTARLSGSKRILVDSLLRSADQLYVIAAECAGGAVVPACWALLPDKRSVTYKKLWELIGFHVDCCPDTAIFDMEVASTSTFLDQFEGATVKSCFFHWRKCLRDNLRKKQAEKDVSSNTAFNLVYRLTVALAFVAPTMVEEVWTRAIVPIIQLNDLPENAKKWAAYFEATYLGSINPRNNRQVAAKIPYQFWNQYYSVLQGLAITNNKVEGWNSGFGAGSTGMDSIWTTAYRLQEEEALGVTKWRLAITQEEQAGEVEDDGEQAVAAKSKRGTARENALRKKEAKLKAACINFATVPREGWGDYLEAVYAVLSGE